MKSKLVFLDTETTGLKDEDRICQLAYKVDELIVNELFHPGITIATEAMAVHHITNEMVKSKPQFQKTEHHSRLKKLIQDGAIIVAHNAPFDLKMLRRDGIETGEYIDTLKVSRYLDTKNEISSHALQNLRYHFGITEEAVAHDAFGDIIILEQIFQKLFEKAEAMAKERSGKDKIPPEKILARMKEISMGHVAVKTFPFGKYKGKLIEDIFRQDRPYLQWFLGARSAKGEADDELVKTIKGLFNGTKS